MSATAMPSCFCTATRPGPTCGQVRLPPFRAAARREDRHCRFRMSCPARQRPRPTDAENPVMLDATEIVRNYVAVWNEADPEVRCRRIEAVWVPDGTSCYRLLGARDYDAIENRVAGSWDKWLRDGKYVFRSKATVCHHDVVKSAWQMVSVPGGRVEANGLSFLVLDPEGRIRHDFQFNPSLN